MFVCTANTLEGIPVSLQDRLETLRYPGYTHSEKRLIARKFLLPKQVKEHGIKDTQISVADAAIDRTIEEYTREAGVRNLGRELASLCRKAAKVLVAEKAEKVEVDGENLQQFLGVPKYHRERNSPNAEGVATGLAWTEVGGVTMAIEVVSMPGKGELKLTGKLGQVMSESAQAALSYIKSIARELGLAPELFKDIDYHIHVPEGATPKDGPSAGIAIATALTSLMTGRAVAEGIAMTGEMTLRGRVLPIGGLKEKVLAAHREGIRTVLYPEANQKDLEDIPAEVLADVRMVPVKHLREVLDIVLAPAPAQEGPQKAAPPPWLGSRPSAPPPGGHS